MEKLLRFAGWSRVRLHLGVLQGEAVAEDGGERFAVVTADCESTALNRAFRAEG